MRVLPGQTTTAGPGGGEHAGLEGDQEHLQCPLSSHHSPVQPAPSTFWEGLPPATWTISGACPSALTQEQTQKKESLSKPVSLCQGSKHHTPYQHPVLASRPANPGAFSALMPAELTLHPS